jgi:glycosyltransferase involved in cell wall biosynthesis
MRMMQKDLEEDLSVGALNVLLCSTEPENSACGQIRVLAPLQRDAEINLRLMQPQRIKQDLRWADVILVQRGFPCPDSRKLLDRIYSAGQPIIYETDDLLSDIPESNPNYNGMLQLRPYLMEAVANSDVLLVSTQELANRLGDGKDTLVVENLLDERLWKKGQARLQDHQVLTIGYAGTPTHCDDLCICEDALERLVAKYPGKIRFLFFGCITSRLQQLPDVTFIPYVPDYSTYARNFQAATIDIGIAPLKDNDFNRSKSAIKWMEMSACGIASVVVDLPPYQSVVEGGKTGLFAGQDSDSWFAALEQLVLDAEMRKGIAQSAMERLYAMHTLESNQMLFSLALRRAIAGTQKLRGKAKLNVLSRILGRLSF